jgi:hypothetical protein
MSITYPPPVKILFFQAKRTENNPVEKCNYHTIINPPTIPLGRVRQGGGVNPNNAQCMKIMPWKCDEEEKGGKWDIRFLGKIVNILTKSITYPLLPLVQSPDF